MRTPVRWAVTPMPGEQLPYDGMALRTGRPVLCVASVTLLVLSACACATGMRQPRSDTGTVTVGVTTSGSGVSTMNFRVTVEPAGISETVRADAGLVTRSNVPSGDHVCTVDRSTGPLPGGWRRRAHDHHLTGPSERSTALSCGVWMTFLPPLTSACAGAFRAPSAKRRQSAVPPQSAASSPRVPF